MGQTGEAPFVSVVVPTRDRLGKLGRCLASVVGSGYPEMEVIVVDDASGEPAESALGGRFAGVRFIRNGERRMLSFSRNAGAAAARGKYVFFLDDDNVVDPGAVGALVGALEGMRPRREADGKDEERARFAVACPVIYYLARPQEVWTSRITRSWIPGFYTLGKEVPPRPVETFSFHNSFLVRRSAFTEAGGFDAVNFPMRFAEVDLAHRLHAMGYRALVEPTAKVWHDLGWSMAHVDSARAYYTERNRMIVIKRYYPRGAFAFYAVCILPFVGGYYLVHHPLSSPDGRMKAASSFLRGVASGLSFREDLRGGRDRTSAR